MEKEFNFREELEKVFNGFKTPTYNFRHLDNLKRKVDEKFEEFIKLLHLDLCAMLEGEILLKKKDIRRVYAIIDKLAGKEFAQA